MKFSDKKNYSQNSSNIYKDSGYELLERFDDHIQPTDVIVSNGSTLANNEYCSEIPKSHKPLVTEKKRQNNIKKWIISNCKNVATALEIFGSKLFEDEFKNSRYILLADFEIDEKFVDIKSDELIELSRKCRQKDIVIILWSREDEKVSIFWKSKNIDNLLLLKSYNELVLENQILLHDFVAKFLLESLQNGHLGLHRKYINRNNASKIELHFLADHHGYNLLLYAAKCGEVEVVNVLLKHGLSPYHVHSTISAQSLALHAGHEDVVFNLLNSNLTFPPSIKINKCQKEIEEFYDVTEQLHNAILANDFKKVEEIINQHKHLRHFYTVSNESAPKIALEHKNIDMYEMLFNNKIVLGPHENIKTIIDKFEFYERSRILNVHCQNSIGMPALHINTLMANSYIIDENENNLQNKLDRIESSFRILNENPYIYIIFKVVATSKKYQIIFDFNQDSMESIDPTSDPNPKFFLSGRIYIGAKQLLHDATKNETFAIIAREFCHYAMFLVFNNEANPYFDNDKQSEQELEEIAQKIQGHCKKGHIEDILYSSYPADLRHAKLIVLPVYMMAYYHNQPEKLQECRKNFHRLFHVYEKKTVSAMMTALPIIEEKSEREELDRIARRNKQKASLRIRFLVSFVALSLTGIFIFIYMKYLYHETCYENKIKNEDVNSGKLSLASLKTLSKI